MNELLIRGKDKVYFGFHKEWQEKIWLTKPEYSCGWYWSFGYLGNRNCNYHLDNYQNGRNINMYDALKEDYTLSPHIEVELWQFCEQAETIYTLKEAAEVLYRGGAHYTSNPLRDFIIENNHNDNLNMVVLPKLLQNFWDQFGKID
jgi:hypothetical protein